VAERPMRHPGYLERPRTPAITRIAIALVVIVALAAGVIVLGRIAPDDRAAMGLTAGWFALVAGVALWLARRRRDAWLPIGLGVVLVSAAVTVLIALPMFMDDEVNERVVVGVPQSQARPDSNPGDEPGGSGRRPADKNVEVANGTFEGLEHSAQGRAAVVELPGGNRRLTLTDFETDSGPDLFVYLVKGDVQGDGDVNEFKDLGRLKGNIGNQQYEVPRDVDIATYSTVVVWCRIFTVAFAKAPLRSS